MAWLVSRLNITANIFHSKARLLNLIAGSIPEAHVLATARPIHISGTCYKKHNINERGEYFPSFKDEAESLPLEETWKIQKDENQFLDDEKMIALSFNQQRKLLRRKPKQPAAPRVARVAIIGMPNAGKSTLANQLIGWRFAAVSSKVHTTRHKAVGVLTEDNKQVVFLDTPGLVTRHKYKRHRLEKSLLIDPHSSLFEADLILVLVDVSENWFRCSLSPQLIKVLSVHADKRAILVLNKIDKLRSKMQLLQTTRLLTEGVVGGQKHWSTAKRKTETAFDKMVERMERVHSPGNKLHSEQSDEFGEAELSAQDRQILSELAKQNEVPIDASVDEGGDKKADCDCSEHLTISDEKMLTFRQEFGDPAEGRMSGQQNLDDPEDWSRYEKTLDSVLPHSERRKRMGWDKFERVFMISALRDDGVDSLREFLLSSTKPSDWLYHHAVVTDQDPIKLAKHCIWEKLLDKLPQELPYVVSVEKKTWEVDDEDILRASFVIVCFDKRQLGFLLGNKGSLLKEVATEAKYELMNTFRRELTLNLSVVKKQKPKTLR